MPNELKPCPFCGGEAIIREGLGKLYVTAFHKKTCLMRVDTWHVPSNDIKKHIKIWNRRVDNA